MGYGQGYGDEALDRARRHISEQKTVEKFGSNPVVEATATEDIWFTGGTFTWLTTAIKLRIKTGGNSADDDGGLGAQIITIEGLDENWEEITEDLVTNGTSVSSSTNATFFRLNRAFVKTCGTYGSANTGDIVIETTAGVELANIEATIGQSQNSMYTVPINKTAYLTHVHTQVDANKEMDIFMFQHPNADDVTTPFRSRREVIAFRQVSQPVDHMFASYPSFEGPCDLWFKAVNAAAGNDAGVSVTYELILIDNGIEA